MDRNEALKTFSNGLIDFMRRTKKTPSDVAELLGVVESNISLYKSGKSLPKFIGVYALLDAGMRLEEIFGNELAEKLTSEFQKTQALRNPKESIKQAKEFLTFLTVQLDKLNA